MKWYVVQIRSGTENKILQQIERLRISADIDEKTMQVLMPVEEHIYFRNGEKKIRKKSFLPGYMLIGTNELTRQMHSQITNLPYVIRIMCRGDKPAPLSPIEVNRILNRKRMNTKEMCIDLIVGERVEIIDGPFMEFLGTVIEIKHDRIIVEVMVFDRTTPVGLDITQVKKVVIPDEE